MRTIAADESAGAPHCSAARQARKTQPEATWTTAAPVTRRLTDERPTTTRTEHQPNPDRVGRQGRTGPDITTVTAQGGV
ncbi:hypothetical protein Abr02nite_57380 [Paractinoplanes brasiliensis]|nr:hypothetical protein Abr02nite_57380 [Actinoplanes brasiliensis]